MDFAFSPAWQKSCPGAKGPLEPRALAGERSAGPAGAEQLRTSRAGAGSLGGLHPQHHPGACHGLGGEPTPSNGIASTFYSPGF